MTIKRDLYLGKLISAKHDGFVKIITGIRRCGKSFLLTKLFRRHLVESGVPSSRIIMVDLDDDKNELLRDPRRLSEWVRRRIRSKASRYYLFIDEIQMCEEVPIVVEGSETKLTFYDHPLSFAEFRQVVKKDEYSAFREYLVYGGMPLCVLKRTESEKRLYLKSLFEKVYLKDVVEHNNVRDRSVLESILDLLSSSVGSLTNSNKLAQQLNSQQGLKTNSPTVTRQIGYLRDAYLFSKVDRYDVQGKRYLDYPSKFYCEDVGLRNVRLNFREFEDAHLMENVIYNELVARGYAVDVGVVEVDVAQDGKTTRKQLEIDFVVNTGFNKIYIQSAYALPDQVKREQETLSLRKSGDFFKKIVVTAANAPAFEGLDGITYIGIIPFLLDRAFLESTVSSASNEPGAFPT